MCQKKKSLKKLLHKNMATYVGMNTVTQVEIP